MLSPSIAKATWDDVRDRFSALNPKIVALIDAIPAKGRPSLYLARYPFGQLIIEKGILQVPFNQGFTSITDTALPKELREDLDYATPPMLVSLNKTSELFLSLDERTYPLHVFDPGKFFGLWPMLDTGISPPFYHQQFWSLASGARTLFMLPKITAANSHSKMQRQLHLTDAYPPHNLFDQGVVFAEIASSSKMHCDWYNEMLFFGKGWFEQLKAGQWPELHHILLQQEWDDSMLLRHHLRVEAMWQVLTHAQAQTHLKPNVYVMDTVKHLLSIAANASLGFTILSEEDEIMAPIATIQNAYLEEYGLKQYIPTLFGPGYLQKRKAVYYSFLSPTLLSLSPNHNFRNTLEDERQIKVLFDLFQGKLNDDPASQTLLSNDIHFDFFHYEPDDPQTIYISEHLPQVDPLLRTFPSDKTLVFAENGPFLRACVRISLT